MAYNLSSLSALVVVLVPIAQLEAVEVPGWACARSGPRARIT